MSHTAPHILLRASVADHQRITELQSALTTSLGGTFSRAQVLRMALKAFSEQHGIEDAAA